MLVIRLSSFQGFVSSEWNHTRAAIENVLIENCFLNSIDKSTIGNFLSLRNVQIKSSQVNSIDDFAFEECCASLSTLNLNGNSIQHLRNNTFVGLENLQYLNLDENPIEAIDSQSFDTFKSNLKKLSLKFTYLKSTTTWLNQVMGSLKELDLSNTFHLNEVDFSQIFSMMPQLEYLALDKSFYLNRFKNLNEILNKI
jgi:Leucine-rich repeat (LRR) protein